MRKMTLRGKIAVVLAIVFITSTFAIGHKYQEQNEKIDMIVEKVDRKEQNKIKLENKLDALQEILDEQKESNKMLIEENKKLKQRNNKLNDELDNLKSRFITVEATAYVAFCDTGCIGVTRDGYDVSNTVYYNGMRIVAVDPRVIPLGTIMEIEFEDGSVFKAIAKDTGGAIKGHKVDFLVKSESRAWSFGRQKAEIRVIEWG